MISATILADSISVAGKRLVTLDLTFPMFVQPQVLRHRAFSFSVQSTRAVPLREQIRRVREEPCVPLRWGAAQKGMVAKEELSMEDEARARGDWTYLARYVSFFVEDHFMNAHQEVAARLLMPFQWCRMIVSATEWDNFFALRIDPHAQAEVRLLAEAIRDAMATSTPRQLGYDEWHLPLIDDEDRAWADDRSENRLEENQLLCLISAGRCARVSFLQHDGTRNPARDLALAKKLSGDAHWSPLEHQAAPLADPNERSGNFVGFKQHRKLYEHEGNRAEWLKEKR